MTHGRQVRPQPQVSQDGLHSPVVNTTYVAAVLLGRDGTGADSESLVANGGVGFIAPQPCASAMTHEHGERLGTYQKVASFTSVPVDIPASSRWT